MPMPIHIPHCPPRRHNHLAREHWQLSVGVGHRVPVSHANDAAALSPASCRTPSWSTRGVQATAKPPNAALIRKRLVDGGAQRKRPAVGEHFALVAVPGAHNRCPQACLLVGASRSGVAPPFACLRPLQADIPLRFRRACSWFPHDLRACSAVRQRHYERADGGKCMSGVAVVAAALLSHALATSRQAPSPWLAGDGGLRALRSGWRRHLRVDYADHLASLRILSPGSPCSRTRLTTSSSRARRSLTKTRR